ncbi:DegT/DnrJ/EryC1/StrS family aminotransferase [Gemmatimonadota bacterium]
MTSIPFLDLSPQNEPLTTDLEAAVSRVIRSGIFILGPEVEEFEESFARFCGVKHAVGLNSGTSALHLGLLALGVGSGDEVITVAHTFAATVEAILYCGAKPVFADLDPDTLVMDVDQVEGVITDSTRAILPVHLYGNPVDMGALMEVAGGYGIPVLEDACQAHGALHRDRPIGGWGEAAAFSFYPTKNLGGLGEGGMVTTDDAEIAAQIRSLRSHGESSRYQHERLGFNYRMSAFQGAVLNVKLAYLEAWNGVRSHLAERYRNNLSGLEDRGLRLLGVTPESEPVVHLFVVLVDERERVMKELAEAGIQTRVFYPEPLYRQPAFAGLVDDDITLPVTEEISEKALSLPLYPGMRIEEVDTVVTHLHEILA